MTSSRTRSSTTRQFVVLAVVWLGLLAAEIANDHWNFLPSGARLALAIAVAAPILLAAPVWFFWGKGGLVGSLVRYVVWAASFSLLVAVPTGAVLLANRAHRARPRALTMLRQPHLR